jgi:hypothetical protein
MIFKLSVTALSTLALLWSPAKCQTPEAIAAPGETKVLQVQAEGSQLYECKSDAAGKLSWQFREPIATLLSEGKTIGRHYAGPNWELQDGSAVVGKVVARAAGATKTDVAWLKLDAIAERGHGLLSGVTTIQRINTKGGGAEGACNSEGSLLNVPYSSDYVFLRRN